MIAQIMGLLYKWPFMQNHEPIARDLAWSPCCSSVGRPLVELCSI